MTRSNLGWRLPYRYPVFGCAYRVGAAAVEHGLPLFTRDRRALGTYRALNVDVRLIS